MKLKSIKKIKEYKSFGDFIWQRFFNNQTFHDKVNIFYGENGAGKTSIVTLLKSVSENKGFDKSAPDDACLVFNDGEKIYSANNGWNKKISKNSILFFDREFVDKNVHLGHRRDTRQGGQEQESGKLIIEFDSEAIRLRNDKDQAKKEKEEQDEKIKKFKNDYSDVLHFALTEDEKPLYEEYKNKTEEEIERLKQKLEKEKREIQGNLEKDKALRGKSKIIKEIESLSINSFDISLSDEERYQAVFDFDLKEQVKIEAEQTLVETIRNHKIFFETGFEIRKKHPNKCPFCQSKNEEEGIEKIVGLYNQIYDETYKARVEQFENDKKILIDELLEIIKAITDFDLDSIFLKLKTLDQKYKIPNIYSVEEEEEYKSKKPTTSKLQDLHNKVKNLEQPKKEKIEESYKKAKKEFEEIKAFFESINSLIDQKNKLIEEFKTANTDAKLQERIDSSSKRIAEIEKELTFVNSNKVKEQRKKEQKEEELKTLKDEFAKRDETYKTALKAYEEYCSTTAFANLLEKIQEYFKKFNFNFKLELKTEPTGNKTEFPFAFKVLDLEKNERDFKDGLSEGEMQVLSLCFFFAFLDIQENKDEKILIFDDPITSLDNSNLSCLVDLIAKEQKKFSQTFIFTHHKTFFKFLRKIFGGNCNEYNLIRNKKELGGSFICKSKAEKFLDKLRNFENNLRKYPKGFDLESKVVEYGQYLRYEVERFVKNDLLHWDSNNFHEVIEGIKRNKSIDDSDLEKIKQIYSFCNWTTSHIDTGDEYGLEQLKIKIADFIKIVDK